MQTPKIIFFDIDDTLYRKYTDTLRPSVAEAMKALKARGILTAIATGRPYAAMPAKVRAVVEEAGMDLLLTINGQFIR
ncbi:HAD hydrolase family protein, partial [Neisseria dentiae]